MASDMGVDLTISNHTSTFNDEYQIVFIPSQYIPPSIFPNSKRILYGPHNFVFPSDVWISPTTQFDSRCVYNVLSKWLISLCNEIAPMPLPLVSLPFSVDTDRFTPEPTTLKRFDCFIYSKRRHPSILARIESYLRQSNLRYTVCTYGSYSEEDYIQIVRESKFGIWIGSHESQGFALEEALSMNCPLLVLDSTTMFDEVSPNGIRTYKHLLGKKQLLCTTVPYWDSRCGKCVYTVEECVAEIPNMMADQSYTPRSYILETLTHEVCARRFLGDT